MFEYLERFEFKPFLPKIKELHQWSDRKKMVEVPLFRSYIFVKARESQIPEILEIPGIAWVIRHGGRAAVLRQSDKDLIELTLRAGYQISEVNENEFVPGDHVKIGQGPLNGLSGEVLKGEKDQILIRIESLDKVIRVQLPAGILTKN